MNIIIKKRHKGLIEITEDGKGLSVKAVVIEAIARETKDELKVILTYSNDTVKSLSNIVDNITLDMVFGGGYELKTFGHEDEIKKQIKFLYCEMMLGRVQCFRYEINTNVSYGQFEMEIALT